MYLQLSQIVRYTTFYFKMTFFDMRLEIAESGLIEAILKSSVYELLINLFCCTPRQAYKQPDREVRPSLHLFFHQIFPHFNFPILLLLILLPLPKLQLLILFFPIFYSKLLLLITSLLQTQNKTKRKRKSNLCKSNNI